MTRQRSIAVVEPQMHNLFHSPFNAALLHAVVLAFPHAAVSFSALPGHAAAVRAILQEHAPEIIPGVDWRTIESSPHGSLLSRWRTNRRIFRPLLKSAERVVFCSISRMQLLQLKRMMTPEDEVVAVLHGDLDRIAEPETERFPANLFSLQRVLLTKQPCGLRFVLLSESIRQNIPAEFSAAFKNAVVIDHPYHFPAAQPASEATTDTTVIFGVFGNSGDGRLLEQVARAVKAAGPNSKIAFRMVGFVSDGEAVARLAPLAEGVGTDPISREEFVRRAQSVNYALWLAPAGSFRLRASGTFFDALAYAKPLVYVANAFIDSYLAPSESFAFRCADIEDLSQAVLRVASQHDAQSYSKAQSAMRKFRARFTPQALAASLASKFGW